ncbi:hypothetical protein CAPTEDRAFT_193356 [Capitella teleta]|uniref:Uncharacterized protein n=1 Tax=Capitella teleta TaxID=283909 RepID=R7UVB4_CAPTE|nr:hypothetical protein CAPTEDRAFT_193356 [Capitella teleta]|eukprot:ELU10053.1 hypothetical protein CAPTEDRAFT_193356 [Capitella teleta]
MSEADAFDIVTEAWAEDEDDASEEQELRQDADMRPETSAVPANTLRARRNVELTDLELGLRRRQDNMSVDNSTPALLSASKRGHRKLFKSPSEPSHKTRSSKTLHDDEGLTKKKTCVVKLDGCKYTIGYKSNL